MNVSSTLDLGVDSVDHSLAIACPAQYAHWGGYPAAVAALDGFETTRANDPKVAAMFAKLDALDAAPRTADGLVDALTACRFEPQELSHINSPLLDGLWNAATGRMPDGRTAFDLIGRPKSSAAFALRLVLPRVYIEALQWFSAGASKDRPWWAEAFVVAAAKGDANSLAVLLPLLNPRHSMLIALGTLRALDNRHIVATRTIFARLECDDSDSFELLFELVDAAAAANEADLLRWLLSEHLPSHPRFSQSLLKSAMLASARNGSETALEYLLQRHAPCSTSDVLLEVLQDAINTAECGAVRVLAARMGFADVSSQLRPDDIVARNCESLSENGFAMLHLLAPWIRSRSFNIQESDKIVQAACQTGSLPLIDVLTNMELIQRIPWTADHLNRVVISGKIDGVRSVLERLDPNLWSDQALFYAAGIGNVEIIDALLHRLQVQNPERAAALRAVRASDGCVGLLDSLPEPQSKAHSINVALLMATRAGNLAAVRWLRTLVKVQISERALQLAIHSKNVAVVQYLLQEGGIAKHTNVALTAQFMLAVGTGDAAMVTTLLEHPMFSAPVESVWTRIWELDERMLLGALLSAAVRKALPMCSLLVSLMERGHHAPAQLLAVLRAAIEAVPADGFAWLITSMLEYLIEVLVVQAEKFPTEVAEGLIWAVEGGHIDMVQLLLDCGASVGHDTNRALVVAQRAGNSAIIEILAKRGVCGGTQKGTMC